MGLRMAADTLPRGWAVLTRALSWRFSSIHIMENRLNPSPSAPQCDSGARVLEAQGASRKFIIELIIALHGGVSTPRPAPTSRLVVLRNDCVCRAQDTPCYYESTRRRRSDSPSPFMGEGRGGSTRHMIASTGVYSSGADLSYPVTPCRLGSIGYSRAIWQAKVGTMMEREVEIQGLVGAPRSLPELAAALPSEEECIDDIYRRRFPHGWPCPVCEDTQAPPRHPARRHIYRCRANHRHEVSLTANTVMHRTKPPIYT